MSQSPSLPGQSSLTDRYVKAWTTTNLLIRQGKSFSGHERHCCFLNRGQLPFADISAISGLDLPEDGRAIAITDWDLDGDLDIWMTNRTAPRVRFFRNDCPSTNHFLQVQLKGTRCNRDAIGARLEVYLAGASAPSSVKSVRAGDGFLGQSSKTIHFGLGQNTQIDRLVVRWPGGETATYHGLEANHRYLVVQGQEPTLLETRSIAPLSPMPLNRPTSHEDARVLLTARVPMPRVEYEDHLGNRRVVFDPQAKCPTLITLWASWCQPCVLELAELAQAKRQLEAHRLRVLALNVEGLQEGSVAPDPSGFLRSIQFPYESGMATQELVNAMDIVQRTILDRKRRLPIPSSFLVTEDGQLAAFYRGRITMEQLADDLKTLPWEPLAIRDAAIPFPGRWSTPPEATEPLRIAVGLYSEGLSNLAKDYTHQVDDFLTNGVGAKYMSEATRLTKRAEAASFRGVIQLEDDQLQDAVESLQRTLEFSPRDLRAHMKLGEAYAKRGNPRLAARHLLTATSIAPNDPDLRYDLAIALGASGASEKAVEHYRAALKLRPGWPPAANNLAWILATHPDAKVREGQAAVELAQQACQRVQFRDPTGLDTLAAALAETGDFQRAVQVARRAIKLSNDKTAEHIKARLALYLNQTPYRDQALGR